MAWGVLATAGVTLSPRLSPLYLLHSGRSWGLHSAPLHPQLLPASSGAEAWTPSPPSTVSASPSAPLQTHTRTSGQPLPSSAAAAGKGKGERVELRVTHTDLCPGYSWPSAPSPGGHSMGGFPAETTKLGGLSSRKPDVGPDLPAMTPSSGFPPPITEQQPGPGSLMFLCCCCAWDLGSLGREGVGSSPCS